MEPHPYLILLSLAGGQQIKIQIQINTLLQTQTQWETKKELDQPI